MLEQSAIGNRLLKAMAPADFALLVPHLTRITTTLHQPLVRSQVPIKHLYFPETGYASVTAENSGKRIEIGLIGHEGLVGATPLLLDSDLAPHDCFIQASGEMLSIGKRALMGVFNRKVSVRRLLLRYVQTFMTQTAQTAFVNASCEIEARLARWLLMCQDRVGRDELQLTHEFLSVMLGVQRTSVTLSLQVLEGGGFIRARRGRIQVRDRDRLLTIAAPGYGVPEAEYALLIEGRR